MDHRIEKNEVPDKPPNRWSEKWGEWRSSILPFTLFPSFCQLPIAMALLQRVLKSMERIAPQSLAEHAWDNVGLLVGKTNSIHKKKPVPLQERKNLTCLFFFDQLS